MINDQLVMLYLAQVAKNSNSGNMELQLLAFQKSDNLWGLGNWDSLSLNQGNSLSEGLLVLVECNENQEIISIKDAKDWILDLVHKYLTNSIITPELIKEEQAKVEQWRQELASQNQDLTRRNLEIETRREQLQELEETIKEEKEKLEFKKQEKESG